MVVHIRAGQGLSRGDYRQAKGAQQSSEVRQPAVAFAPATVLTVRWGAVFGRTSE